MNSSLWIHQATKADTSNVAELLAHTPYIHRHLDWQSILEWIPYEPFLILKNETKILGILACPPEPKNVAWIRCFACTLNIDPALVWRNLFSLVTTLPILKDSSIFSVGLNDWFSDLLVDSGFLNIQNIVVLAWNHHMPQLHNIDADILIRPMEYVDIPEVTILDNLAFEPIWTNSQEKIAMAYEQSEHSSVAEVNGKIIAYELSTSNNYSAHLARIAVDPAYQKKHIAANMIVEMFKYFSRRGVHEITVNTQDNNQSSLSLYHSTGFEFNGEKYPVFRFSI